MVIADLYPGLVVSPHHQLLTIESVSSPKIQQFHQYWLSKCRDAAPPRRDDIDPAEIKTLLPYIAISRLEANPFRIFYRLYGTGIAMYDNDMTGNYVDEVPDGDPPWKEYFTGVYRWIATHRRPLFGRSYHMLTDYRFEREYLYGMWPLTDSNQIIEQVVTIEDYLK